MKTVRTLFAKIKGIDKTIRLTIEQSIINGNKSAFFIGLVHPYYLNWRQVGISAKASVGYVDGIVIDVGSGESPYFQIYKGKIKKYYSLDYPVCREKMDVGKTSDSDIHGDAHDLPIKTESIDTVLLNQVLEHVQDPEKVLFETNRILKKNGKLIISVPFLYPIHIEPFDYFRFSEYGIKHLLGKNNFKIILFNYNGFTGTAIIGGLNHLINKLPSRYLIGKIAIRLFGPIIFIFMNIIGLILDIIFPLKEMTPNYWVVAEKI